MEKANIIRKCYFFNKILIRRGARLINYRITKTFRRKIKVAAKTSKIVVVFRPNNTFISLINKGFTHYLVTGGLADFSGPKRSSPYARYVVARTMRRYVIIQGFKKLDIYFNSRTTRRFFFLFKGLISRKYNIRFIARNKMVAHGRMRNKKKRRK